MHSGAERSPTTKRRDGSCPMITPRAPPTPSTGPEPGTGTAPRETRPGRHAGYQGLVELLHHAVDARRHVRPLNLTFPDAHPAVAIDDPRCSGFDLHGRS